MEKKRLSIEFTVEQRNAIHSIAIQRGFRSTAAYIRALLLRDIRDPVCALDKQIAQRALELLA